MFVIALTLVAACGSPPAGELTGEPVAARSETTTSAPPHALDVSQEAQIIRQHQRAAEAARLETFYAVVTWNAVVRWNDAVAAYEAELARAAAAEAEAEAASAAARRQPQADDGGGTSTGRCGGNLPPCSVMECESGGDIHAQNPSSSASGKWQIIDSTWNGYGGYPTAASAPEHVQDAKAAELYAGGAGRGHWVC